MIDRISVCVDMMFAPSTFNEKLIRCKNCNFKTIEFWKWSNKNLNEIINSGLNVSIFNLDSSNDKLSYDLSRGIINDGRVDDFISALNDSVPVYKKLNAKAMIVLIGENANYSEENCLKCLLKAKPILEKENVNLVIEPLNATDRVGYSMPYVAPVFDLVKKVNSKHVKVLYDIYHQNVTGDFDLDNVIKNLEYIGHFHVADAPGRHEPGSAKIDYVKILNTIIKSGYKNYIGLEYRATKRDEDTFEFLNELVKFKE